MIITHRAIVDDEGTIRLLGLAKLREGSQVLATVVDRDALVWLFSNKVQPVQNTPTQNKYPYCLCGCSSKNHPRNPKARFNPGHDMTAVWILRRVKEREIDAGELPNVLIEAARKHPDLQVHEFTAEKILNLAGENKEAVLPSSLPTPSAMNDYRAVVDEKGTISLLNPVELEEGTHILVTLVDRDSLIAPMRLSGRTALPEERIRKELQEDEAWAYLLKEVPS